MMDKITTIPGDLLIERPFQPSQGSFSDDFNEALKGIMVAYWDEVRDQSFESRGTFHLSLSVERGERNEQIGSLHRRRAGD